MTADWIALTIALAVFAAANALSALAVWLVWPSMLGVLARAQAAARARLALLARLLPFAVSVGAAVAATGAFLVHEPRGIVEPVGIALRTLAALGAGCALATVVRTGWVVAASERLAARWTHEGTAIELPGASGRAWLIDTAFPIVAVVGILRPRLVVARSVAEGCSPDELAAMAAHERAHIGSADNLKRLLLWSVADLLAITRRSRRIAACWQSAAEEAADDHAAARGVPAVDLASALVSVARLAADRTAMGPLPASVFHRGGSVERRVRRLLDRADSAGAAPRSGVVRWLGPCVGAIATALMVCGGTRPIYGAVEWLVRSLP